MRQCLRYSALPSGKLSSAMPSDAAHTPAKAAGESAGSPLSRFIPSAAGSSVAVMTEMDTRDIHMLTWMMWLRLASRAICHPCLLWDFFFVCVFVCAGGGGRGA